MENATDKKTENGFSVAKNVDSTSLDRKEIFPEEKGEEVNENEENIQGSHHFMELYEESLKSIREGKVVKGEIVQIDKEFVLVDIGYKSEGQIRIAEFINPRGGLTAKVGDEVDVLLVRKENKEGRIILSKEKAAGVKLWDKVEEAFRKQDDHQRQNNFPGEGRAFCRYWRAGFLAWVSGRSETSQRFEHLDRNRA